MFFGIPVIFLNIDGIVYAKRVFGMIGSPSTREDNVLQGFNWHCKMTP